MISTDMKNALKGGASPTKAYLEQAEPPRSSFYPAVQYGLRNGLDRSVATLLQVFEPDPTVGTEPMEDTLQEAIERRLDRSRAETGQVEELYETLVRDLSFDLDYVTIIEKVIENDDHERFRALIDHGAIRPEQLHDIEAGLKNFVRLIDRPDFLRDAIPDANPDRDARLLKAALRYDKEGTVQCLIDRARIDVDDVRELIDQKNYQSAIRLLKESDFDLDNSRPIVRDHQLASTASNKPDFTRTIFELDEDRTILFYHFATKLDIEGAPLDLIRLCFERLTVDKDSYEFNHYMEAVNKLAKHPNTGRDTFSKFFERVSELLPDDRMYLSTERLQDMNEQGLGPGLDVIMSEALKQEALTNVGEVLRAALDGELPDELVTVMLEQNAELTITSIEPAMLEEFPELCSALESADMENEKAPLDDLLQDYLHDEDVSYPQPEVLDDLREAGARLLDFDFAFDDVYDFKNYQYRSDRLVESFQALNRLGVKFDERPDDFETLIENSYYTVMEQLKKVGHNLPEIELTDVEIVVESGCEQLFAEYCPDRLVNADIVYATTRQQSEKLLKDVLSAYSGRVDVLSRALRKAIERDAPPTFVDCLIDAGADPLYADRERPPLCAAIEHDGDVPAVERVSQILSELDDEPGPDVYQVAVRADKPEVLERLLEYHCPETLDDLLQQAAARARNQCAEVLLRHGADPGVKRSEVLFEAAGYGLDLIKMLVDGGANPGARDGGLMIRAAFEQNIELVKWLAEQDVTLHERVLDVLWAALLQELSERELIQFLLDAGPKRFDGHETLQAVLSTHDQTVDDIREAPIAQLFVRAIKRSEDYELLQDMLEAGLPLNADDGQFIRWVDEISDRDDEDYERLVELIEPYRTGRSQQARTLRERADDR